MATKKEIKAALELFGPNGEIWTKGTRVSAQASSIPPDKQCALTAAAKISQEVVHALDAELRKYPGGFISIPQFNDLPETTFADVKALFERAIESAQEPA